MAAQRVLSADDALQRLVLGNRRFSAGRPAHPHQTPRRRRAIAPAQRPFAAVLGCADSRVPPEIVFDQGLGDLFVVRVAGHIVDSAVLGSLEMAVDGVELRLIVVLGHDLCAAVAATVEHRDLGAGSPAGHLPHLIEALKPAVEQAAGLLDHAIDANVSLAVQRLAGATPILDEHVRSRGLRIVGARYRAASGQVTFQGLPAPRGSASSSD